MTVARLGYEIDSSGAVVAAKNLDDMAASAKKADNIADQLKISFDQMAGEIRAMTTTLNMSIKSMGGLSSAAQVSEKVIDSNTLAINELRASLASMANQGSKPAQNETEKLGVSLERLRSKYNPLYAASKQYEAALNEIARAEEIGAINATQAAAARDRAAASMSGGVLSANKFGTAIAGSSSQTANLGAQLNDIGVMLAAGQNPLQLAVQQGTQINQVFAQMGGGRQALRGLAAGFMSMVNPMSLATIGIIAGGAALVQWAVAAAGAGEEADALADAMKSIEESTRNAKLELQAMQMGLENVEQVLVQQKVNALMSQREVLLDRLGRLEGQSDIHSVRKAANIKQQIKLLGNEIASLNKIIDEESKALQAIEQQNYLLESANMFLEAQQRIRNENGAEMARQLRLEEDITKELGAGAVEALKLAGVDLDNLDDAARRAASLAASMGIAYGEAYALANVTFPPMGGGLTPDMPNLLPPSGDDTEAPRGGGGGVDRRASQVEAFVKSLQTEREQLTAWYAEQQELLAMANAAELEAIGGHNEAKLRLEAEYNERKKELQDEQAQYVVNAQAAAQGAALDFLSTLSGQSETAAKALIAINTGLSIAEAIQNTATAATKALAIYGPTPQGFAAAGAVKAYGAAQVALIAANGALKIGRTGGSGGGAGSASSAGVTATSATAPAPQRQDAVIQLEGALADVLAPLMDSIVSELQSRSEDGVNIVGVTAR